MILCGEATEEMTMNESRCNDERRDSEDIKMADLGDAKEETKQAHVFPVFWDSSFEVGWF